MKYECEVYDINTDETLCSEIFSDYDDAEMFGDINKHEFDCDCDFVITMIKDVEDDII